jgi:hypothetical protein
VIDDLQPALVVAGHRNDLMAFDAVFRQQGRFRGADDVPVEVDIFHVVLDCESFGDVFFVAKARATNASPIRTPSLRVYSNASFNPASVTTPHSRKISPAVSFVCVRTYSSLYIQTRWVTNLFQSIRHFTGGCGRLGGAFFEKTIPVSRRSACGNATSVKQRPLRAGRTGKKSRAIGLFTNAFPTGVAKGTTLMDCTGSG